MTTMPGWVAAYMDIPFRDHGRDRAGCDCYGLVRLVLAERFGLELPVLVAGYRDTQDRAEIARMIDHHRPLLGFASVAAPRPGDVVHMRNGGGQCHLGIMVTERLMLHTEEPAGPRLEEIRRPALAPRIEGFYRHG